MHRDINTVIALVRIVPGCFFFRLTRRSTMELLKPFPLLAALVVGGLTAASAAAASDAVTFQDWSVECRDDVCIAAQSSFGPQETWLATVRLQQAENGTAIVQVLVPAGVHLGSGLFVQLKSGAPLEVPFVTCTPQMCQAATRLPADAVSGWKNARSVALRYRPTLDAAPIAFDVSMMGVTAALEKTGASG